MYCILLVAVVLGVVVFSVDDKANAQFPGNYSQVVSGLAPSQ